VIAAAEASRGASGMASASKSQYGTPSTGSDGCDSRKRAILFACSR
jgi:hypothetical protein